MIQDIAPYRFYNEYEPAAPKPSDTVFVFEKRQVLALQDQEDGFTFPKAGAYRDELLQYLFRIDEQRYYLYRPENGAEKTGTRETGFEFFSLMDVRRGSDLTEMFACMTAYHLLTWYDKNRYCGRCGQPFADESDLECSLFVRSGMEEG